MDYQQLMDEAMALLRKSQQDTNPDTGEPQSLALQQLLATQAQTLVLAATAVLMSADPRLRRGVSQ